VRLSRMPEIADLIVEHCREYKKEYVGIVVEIELDSYGHQRNVHIHWSISAPDNYNDRHGHSGINIHNIRSRFRVFRHGIEIK